ncbi:hypothetical protein [Gemmata massiliana]|uniref:hypothetical protein n=1 Tax=Gemmata massiliana TaxID=1210884 RepID=UPI0013A6DEFC|nr:hypothetical protein [Gemmata massiliana]
MRAAGEFSLETPEVSPVPKKGIGPRLFGLLGGALLLAKRAPRVSLVGFAAALMILVFAWVARGASVSGGTTGTSAWARRCAPGRTGPASR